MYIIIMRPQELYKKKFFYFTNRIFMQKIIYFKKIQHLSKFYIVLSFSLSKHTLYTFFLSPFHEQHDFIMQNYNFVQIWKNKEKFIF